MYNMAGMSTSSVGDKTATFTSSLLEGEIKSGTRFKLTDETMEVQFQKAQQIVLQWDSMVSKNPRPRQEIDDYLQAIDEILPSMESTTVADDVEQSKKVNTTIQVAMACLQNEFHNILISHATPIETELLTKLIPSTQATSKGNSSFSEFYDTNDSSLEQGESRITIASNRSMSSTIREIELIPMDTIYDLRCITERMITTGYFRECVQVYVNVRMSVVNSSFKNLGVEELNIGDIQGLSWEFLKVEIEKWIHAVRVCFRVIFASEKRLCQLIFKDLETEAGDVCFMETVEALVIQLFNFAKAISISHPATEKLVKILDLHNALLDLLPDINMVFDSHSSESIRVQANDILSRLAEAVRKILSEFENSVLREPSKIPVPGGIIHPLTRFVMSYISLISDRKQTLGELIVSRPATGTRYSHNLTTPDMDFTDHEGQSPLAIHLIWITVILQFNLEGKSRHYKNNSLAYVFMMNNIHYIVQKIKGSLELREMIGDDYLEKLTGKYKEAANSYQRATWAGVLHCLRYDGLHISVHYSKSALRERFKLFNSMFEEIHKMQASWLIPDAQLRKELQISISEELILAYRSFLERFRIHVDRWRHPESYIKYSVEDLETAICDFFEGLAVDHQPSRIRTH